MEEINEKGRQRACYSGFAGFCAFALGLLLGPLGLAAGLVIYGLARDKEQQAFGWLALFGGILPTLVLVALILVAFFMFGLGAWAYQDYSPVSR